MLCQTGQDSRRATRLARFRAVVEGMSRTSQCSGHAGAARRKRAPTPCPPSIAASKTTVGPTSSIGGPAAAQSPDQENGMRRLRVARLNSFSPAPIEKSWLNLLQWINCKQADWIARPLQQSAMKFVLQSKPLFKNRRRPCLPSCRVQKIGQLIPAIASTG